MQPGGNLGGQVVHSGAGYDSPMADATRCGERVRLVVGRDLPAEGRRKLAIVLAVDEQDRAANRLGRDGDAMKPLPSRSTGFESQLRDDPCRRLTAHFSQHEAPAGTAGVDALGLGTEEAGNRRDLGVGHGAGDGGGRAGSEQNGGGVSGWRNANI